MLGPKPSPERGLPANLDAERFVLGSALVKPDLLAAVSDALKVQDFSLHKHRIIYQRMLDLQERSERIDRVTVAEELMKHHQLEACDGIGYLVSLDDGMPSLPNVDGYVRIVLEKSRRRLIIFAAQQAAEAAMSAPEGPEIIAAGFMEQLSQIETRSDDSPIHPAEFLEKYEGGLNALLTPQPGIPTGFVKLDEMLDGGGFQPENVYVLGSESSRGKSSLSLNIAMNLVRRDIPVAFYSLEMGKRSLFHRAMCGQAEVSLWKFKHGYCSEVERLQLQRSATQISAMPLYWDCRNGLSLGQLRRRLARLHREKDIKLAVVDYLQIMDWAEGVKEMRHGFVRITKGVKELARELKVPILLLSQVTRDKARGTSKNPRPRMSDLRESSSIENDADAIFFIYRPEYDNPGREELKGTAELVVAKQRDGPTGIIPLYFEGSYLKFKEEIPADKQKKNVRDGKAAAGGKE